MDPKESNFTVFVGCILLPVSDMYTWLQLYTTEVAKVQQALCCHTLENAAATAAPASN